MKKSLKSTVEIEVVGMAFHTTIEARKQMASAFSKGNLNAALEREPTNKVDPNAIKVVSKGFGQVGYVPRLVAEVLAPRLDSGEAKIVSANFKIIDKFDRTAKLIVTIEVAARRRV